jgi:hypothetical protein
VLGPEVVATFGGAEMVEGTSLVGFESEAARLRNRPKLAIGRRSSSLIQAKSNAAARE